MAVRADGMVTLLNFTEAQQSYLIRYRADGELDQTFGDRGSLQLPVDALYSFAPLADGGLVVSGRATNVNSPIARADAPLWRVTPGGRFDPSSGSGGRLLRLGFGGGSGGTFLASRHRALPPLRKSSFRVGQIVERPDGSFLVVGGVRVSGDRPDGTRVQASRLAVAALTPDLARDPRFGGRGTPPRLRARVLSRSAAVGARLKRLLVSVTASAPSLVLVRARVGRVVIADALEPVLAAGRVSAKLRLTRAGERLLADRRRLRINVAATMRDLLGREVPARATATLRP